MNISETIKAEAKQFAQNQYENMVAGYIKNADAEFTSLTRGKLRSEFTYIEREELLQKLLASAIHHGKNFPDFSGRNKKLRQRLNVALEGERRLNEQSLSTTTDSLIGTLNNFAEAAE